jgi:hypothetical protein
VFALSAIPESKISANQENATHGKGQDNRTNFS